MYELRVIFIVWVSGSYFFVLKLIFGEFSKIFFWFCIFCPFFCKLVMFCYFTSVSEIDKFGCYRESATSTCSLIFTLKISNFSFCWKKRKFNQYRKHSFEQILAQLRSIVKFKNPTAYSSTIIFPSTILLQTKLFREVKVLAMSYLFSVTHCSI